MASVFLLISNLCVIGGVAGFVVARRKAWGRAARGQASAHRSVATVQLPDPEQGSDPLRRMRHAAYQLRSIGMALHGTAGALAEERGAHADTIAEAADNAFELAEDLHEYALRAVVPHVIENERLYLASVLDETLRDIDRAIAPGVRAWIVGPDVSSIHVRADRRALRFILRDLLSVAVRSTGNGDAITITFDRINGDFALLVEYIECDWVPLVSRLTETEDEARGALRLTLVRRLIGLHGGRVELVSRSASGTVIRLHVPRERVLDGTYSRRIVHDGVTTGAA